MPDLSLLAIGLILLLFLDLLFNSFLYFISKSSVKLGIGGEQNSIWSSLKDIIESFLAWFLFFCIMLLIENNFKTLLKFSF